MIGDVLMILSTVFKRKNIFVIFKFKIQNSNIDIVPLQKRTVMNTYLLLMAGGDITTFLNPLLFIGMILVFYLLIFRPQMKKAKEQQNFWGSLTKGQKVVTTGGMHGKITQVKDDVDYVLMEIAKDTVVKVAKTGISQDLSTSLQVNQQKAKKAEKIETEASSE